MLCLSPGAENTGVHRDHRRWGGVWQRTYLLKLWRAERVVELLRALGQRLSRGQIGHQPLLHLRVGQDGGHDLRGQDAGEVHCREQKEQNLHIFLQTLFPHSFLICHLGWKII